MEILFCRYKIIVCGIVSAGVRGLVSWFRTFQGTFHRIGRSYRQFPFHLCVILEPFGDAVLDIAVLLKRTVRGKVEMAYLAVM